MTPPPRTRVIVTGPPGEPAVVFLPYSWRHPHVWLMPAACVVVFAAVWAATGGDAGEWPGFAFLFAAAAAMFLLADRGGATVGITGGELYRIRRGRFRDARTAWPLAGVTGFEVGPNAADDGDGWILDLKATRADGSATPILTSRGGYPFGREGELRWVAAVLSRAIGRPG